MNVGEMVSDSIFHHPVDLDYSSSVGELAESGYPVGVGRYALSVADCSVFLGG
jgi:hypothetical protein